MSTCAEQRVELVPRRARCAASCSRQLLGARQRAVDDVSSPMPAACKWRADSSPILPAPTTSTWRPVRSPKICCARARPRPTRSTPTLRATSVSVRTRLASANGARHARAAATGPSVPASLRRGVRLLDLAEDLRLAHHHRVERRGDAEQVAQGIVARRARTGARASSAGSARSSMRKRCSASSAARVVDADVELDAVAGRARSSPRRRRARATRRRSASARASSEKATRSRTSIGRGLVREADDAELPRHDYSRALRRRARSRSRAPSATWRSRRGHRSPRAARASRR